MTYRVHVRVMPRRGLLDPQGQAVEHALKALAFAGAGNVHVGKAIELDIRRINWKRAIDMNDRALRSAVIGLGGPNGGIPRVEGWSITASRMPPASRKWNLRSGKP